jgi:metal transporter CNNM
VWPDQKLGDVLTVFKKSRGHMALVVDVNSESTTEDPFYELVGIITLEDIMEEILGEAVLDETDIDEAEQMGLTLPGVEMDKRERELARLKMLSGKLAEDKLTSEEVQAITSHLTTNVPQIQRLLTGTSVLGTQVVTVEQIHQMVVRGCKVIEITRKAHPDAVLRMEPAPEDILYKRNKPSNVCTLILSGRVTVQAGKDMFRSEVGPWSLLGADSLEQEDGSYVPDYTAFVSSDVVRCLIITKANLRKCWLGYDEIAIDPRRQRKMTPPHKARKSASSTASSQDSPQGTPKQTSSPRKGKLKLKTSTGYGQINSEDEVEEVPVKGGGEVLGGEGVEMLDHPASTRLRSNSLT